MTTLPWWSACAALFSAALLWFGDGVPMIGVIYLLLSGVAWYGRD